MRERLGRWGRAVGGVLGGGIVAASALFLLLDLLRVLAGRTSFAGLLVSGAGSPTWVIHALGVALAVGLAGGPRRALRAGAWGLAILCAFDAVAFLVLRARGEIHAPSVLSLSLVLAVALALEALRPATAAVPSARRALLAAVPGAVGLVLLHVLTFGATDYRQPADAAIVLGAAVRSDGTASGALRDRTVTACRLHQQGLVRHLVLSGGHGADAPVSEPACMERLAKEYGVPEHALLRDEQGRNSAATLVAVRELAAKHGWRRVLVVSNDYHLARLHLLGRDLDLEVRTVPAAETVPWPTKPLFVLREVAAWGVAFVRAAL